MTTLDTAPATAPTSAPKATIDRFHAEAAALRKTLDELDHIHRDAWQQESEAARKAIAGLQADLALAAAEAQAERAQSREDLHDALTQLVNAWRSRVDDLVVQRRLAEMDARDAVERLRHDMRRPVHDLRIAALHAIDQLRRAVAA
jgi:hypothetical protein